MRLINPSF